MASLLGETTQEEWKRRIQENPGPWGELATDNIILTVPTANLRALENPEPLLRLWDEVMQAVARLGAEPFPLRLPQRIVADVQISVGGYPIPLHADPSAFFSTAMQQAARRGQMLC